ncbi:MAG: hypothetical protein IJX84_04550 [Clostridia bacterium]|nr:hypothetical protein [Clostridia bacterium]
MKKICAVLMVVILLMGMSCAFAQEANEELPVITFRNMRLGSTVKEIRADMDLSLSKGNVWNLYDFSSIKAGRSFALEEVAGADEVYLEYDLSGVDVAGFTCSYGKALFFQPVVDGQLTSDEESAVLFGGFYDLFPNPEEMTAAEEELADKLTKLYGDAVTEEELTVWHGVDNVDIVMYVANSSNQIRLSYLWMDAQDAISESFAQLTQKHEDRTGNNNGL